MPPNVPLLTIITVHLSQFAQLQSTLGSLRTTLADARTEWIVIDGGSDWAEHSALRNEIRALAATFISEPDAGTYDAMNKGTAYAHGQYALFMNAGDLLLLPGIVSFLQSHISNAQAKTAPPDLLVFHAKEGHNLQQSYIKRFRQLSALWYGMPTHHQATIFKTQVCRQYPYDTRYRLAADYKVLCQAYKNCASVHYENDVLCYFDLNGISSNNFYAGLREEENIRREIMGTGILKNFCIRLLRGTIRTTRIALPPIYQRLRYVRQ